MAQVQLKEDGDFVKEAQNSYSLSRDEEILFGRDALLRSGFSALKFFDQMEADKAQALNTKVTNLSQIRTLKMMVEEAQKDTPNSKGPHPIIVSDNPKLVKVIESLSEAGIEIPVQEGSVVNKAGEQVEGRYIDKNDLQKIEAELKVHSSNFSDFTKNEQLVLKELFNKKSVNMNIFIAHSKNKQDMLQRIADMTRRG